LIEFVELAKHMQCFDKVLQAGTGVTGFHTPNSNDRSAKALGQVLLAPMPAAAGQRHANAQLLKAA
jgi:hypothetical protein